METWSGDGPETAGWRPETGFSGSRMQAEIQGPARKQGYGSGVSKSEVGAKGPPGSGASTALASSPERRGSYFWPGWARTSHDWRMPSPAAMRAPQPSVLVTSSARPWNRGCPTAHRPRSQRLPPEAMARRYSGTGAAIEALPLLANRTLSSLSACPPRSPPLNH